MKILLNKLLFAGAFILCMSIGAAAQSNDPKKPAPPKPKPPIIKPKPKPTPKKPGESGMVFHDGFGLAFTKD